MFSLAKKNTLIVEDFAEFARSVRAMLHTMGATNVDIVYNAEDGIESCKNRKYDIILSDYNLGSKKDGQQFLEELSKYQLIKSNCVFLMLTAENTTAMVMGAVEYQPDGYIAKPFNGNLLKSRLQKSIERKDTLQPINKAINNKKWQQALENIELILPEHPKYKMSCLRLKYKSLKALKKYNQALELVTEIVSIRTIPWALEAVGEMFYLKKDLKRAHDIFNSMIKEFPMALEGYDWLARIQKDLGQPIEAQNTLIKAIDKSPKALQRQKNLASIAEINNDLPIMTKAYRCAVKYGTNSAFSSPDEYIKLSTALSKNIQENKDTSPEKIVLEAELLFKKLGKTFAATTSNMLRANVAQASFYHASGDEEKVEKHLHQSEKFFKDNDEQLSADVSLELAEKLKTLGKTDIADEILNDAIQQNLDNPSFLKQAATVSSNDNLLKVCKQAAQYNSKAVTYFKQNKYLDAIEWFEKSHQLSSKNINIGLNYIQTLLKQAQKSKQPAKLIEKADKVMSLIPSLTLSDKRFNRYSELKRLIQIMLQQH